jgi:diaminopimelate decarboxylase
MTVETPWWSRDGLTWNEAGLSVGGRSASSLATANGTPLYVYDAGHIRERIASLRGALAGIGAPSRIYYAIKANRFGPLVAAIRAEGNVGIDACSPREVALAREHGFAPDEISVTTSMPSNADLDAFVAAGVRVNLDSLSSLRRFAARAPRGTSIGLRIDAAVEVGYGTSPKVAYGNSKFGIEHEAVEKALALAREGGLEVRTLHVHCGWGLQARALPKVSWVFEHMARFARSTPGLEMVNIGGGLVGRHAATDEPLQVEAWVAAIRRHLGPLGVTLACEPGTWLVDDAGILIVEANTVEEKAGTNWIGVDAGHNVNVYMAHYGIPLEVVHVARPADPAEITYTVAGNLNESNDVFARDVRLPRVVEGDLLAFLPAGAYGSSMSSDHCLRGMAGEVLV